MQPDVESGSTEEEDVCAAKARPFSSRDAMIGRRSVTSRNDWQRNLSVIFVCLTEWRAWLYVDDATPILERYLLIEV